MKKIIQLIIIISAASICISCSAARQLDSYVNFPRMIYITDALLKRGFSEFDIRKIMGENTIRVMREVLP